MKVLLKQSYSFHQLGTRTNQEDARFPDSNVPLWDKNFFVVCDGVGGHEKGEVASRTVADAIGEYMSNVDLTRDFNAKDFSFTLEYAYSKLSKAMKNGGSEMATTLTFLCFHNGGAFCAYIGDSRIYHIRPGVGILYRSDDHSLVNVLVHSGNITPEEAMNHPQSNIITRCMGYIGENSKRLSASTIQIDDIENGDYFLLCTDGVLQNMDESRLTEIISSEISDDEKIKVIAEQCFYSRDNNTAYLIGVDSVTHDIEDTDEVACDNMSPTTDTRPLCTNNNEVIEVLPHSKQSIAEKVSDFINKLF